MEEDIGERVSRIHGTRRVDVVTGRTRETVQAAKAWLEKHKVPYDTFVRTTSIRAKANLSYDVFVDDSSELMSAVAASFDRWGILYAQPWNRTAKEMPRIFRVETWEEIPALLEQVSATKRANQNL